MKLKCDCGEILEFNKELQTGEEISVSCDCFSFFVIGCDKEPCEYIDDVPCYNIYSDYFPSNGVKKQ